jgi:uncharacterized phage-associated protein
MRRSNLDGLMNYAQKIIAKKEYKMAISSLAVANFFVEKSLATGVELTPMKVIKMVYIAHGWNLAFDRGLLISEAVEAWKFGPVVPSVYNTFSKYKDQKITALAQTIELINGKYVTVIPQVDDPTDKIFLESVWNVYSKFTGWQLSALTHQPNTPWDAAWNTKGGKDISGATIDNDDIQNHYKQLREERYS